MKYRKKPVIVEAKQWFPPGHEQHDPSMLVHRKGNTVNPPDYRRVGDLYLAFEGGLPNIGGDDIFMVRTLEGNLKVSPGDWIIIGVKGEKYPCKPDVFEATYELVKD